MSGVATAIGASALIGGGVSMYSANKNADAINKANSEAGYQTAPEYTESEAARGTWWDKLQEWGSDPNYGNLPFDWGGIWENAKKKVQNYYWGGPGGQIGLADKVRASAARKNTSDSPALENNLMKMGYQEAGQYQDIATNMAMQETNLANQGKDTWLNSLMSIAGRKPQSQYITPNADVYPDYGPMIADVGGSIGGIIGQQQNYGLQKQSLNNQNDWMTKMLEEMRRPQPTTADYNAGMSFIR